MRAWPKVVIVMAEWSDEPGKQLSYHHPWGTMKLYFLTGYVNYLAWQPEEILPQIHLLFCYRGVKENARFPLPFTESQLLTLSRARSLEFSLQKSWLCGLSSLPWQSQWFPAEWEKENTWFREDWILFVLVISYYVSTASPKSWAGKIVLTFAYLL